MNTFREKLKFVTLIGTIKDLSVHLRKKYLLTIYKSATPDNPVNESLMSKLEKVQYQTCLSTAGAIQGTSRESLYKELGLESLQSRRWCRKMKFFYKTNGLTPKYLFDIIPASNDSCCNTRAQSKLEITQL